MDKGFMDLENQIEKVDIPHQKIDDIIQSAILNGRNKKKKKRVLKRISYIASATVFMLGITISSAFISPSMASIVEKIPVLGTIVKQMSDAIFNFDTLEATYIIKDHGEKIEESYVAFDYNSNLAYGVTVDTIGQKKTESLIKNGKWLEYSHIDNRYYEGEQLVKERKRTNAPRQPGVVRFHSNPLSINVGKATIAISDPQQYAEGLMEWANHIVMGESQFLDRTVVVVEVHLPDEGDMKERIDTIKLYVDKETGLILKMTEYFNQELVSELYATMIKVNQPIRKSIFHLEIPKGAVNHSP